MQNRNNIEYIFRDIRNILKGILIFCLFYLLRDLSSFMDEQILTDPSDINIIIYITITFLLVIILIYIVYYLIRYIILDIFYIN